MSVIRGNPGVNGLADGSGEMPEVPSAGREETVRALVGDRALDLLLARSKDEAGQLRLTGEGSMLGELVKATGWPGSRTPSAPRSRRPLSWPSAPPSASCSTPPTPSKA